MIYLIHIPHWLILNCGTVRAKRHKVLTWNAFLSFQRCLALILNQLNSMESVTAQAISTQVQRRLGELTDTELICFLDGA